MKIKFLLFIEYQYNDELNKERITTFNVRFRKEKQPQLESPRKNTHIFWC